MSKPASRTELIEYGKRQLGAPVLEINVADEQVSDLVDDAFQFWNERHYDGVVKLPLKYQFTDDDISRGNGTVGIVTTTVTQPASTGIGTTAGADATFKFEENSNYIKMPDTIVGVNKIYRFDGSNTMTNNMFSVKYQLFLNDVYYFDSLELLTYAMTKTKLEDIDFLLNTEKQIRYNIRQDRLYLDIDWGSVSKDEYIIIDCWRVLDPSDSTKVFNDRFLKRYFTALLKRQWGQNLIKFQGVKLPGGIELNGRQIYDDAQLEIDKIQDRMTWDYEELPLDLIG
tara:strand:- start:1717 stop:2568 length:852 start_codon:yes stop_codon:yes gene_type:complete